MNKLHSAIITSVVLGCLLVVLAISLISPQEAVSAGPLTVVTLTATSGSTAYSEAAAMPAKPTPAPLLDYIPASEDQPSVYVKIVQDAKAASEQANYSVPTDGCPLYPSYPDAIQQWCGLISQAATDTGLDPNFIAAVMLQESGGNPEAYSRSGAVGLLQVMPRDGLAASFMCPNGPCFANRPTSEELFDPAFNIQFGTRMLAGLANRHGDLREALKAYGPIDIGYSYADRILSIYQNYR